MNICTRTSQYQKVSQKEKQKRKNRKNVSRETIEHNLKAFS
jgi:hypothetical protein